MASQTCHLDPDRPTQSTINVSKLQKHVHIYKVTWHENTISTRVRGQKSDLWCKVVYGNLENRHILKRLCVEDVKKRVKRVNIIQTSGFPSLLNWKIKEVLRESLNTQVSLNKAYWTSKVNLHKSKCCLTDENKQFVFFFKLFIQCCLCDLLFVRSNVHDPISEKFCMVVKRRKTNNFMIPLVLSYGLRIWRLSV